MHLGMRSWAQGVCVAALALWAGLGQAGELTVVQIAPQTGPYGGVGWHLELGARVYFDELNAHGGIAGNRIRLVSVDEEERPLPQQVEALAKQYSPTALLGFANAAGVQALLKERTLEKLDLPLVGVRSGETDIVHATSNQLFLTRASYADEIARVFKQFTASGMRSMGLIYEDDSYGRDVLRYAQEQAKAANVKLTAVAYPPGSALVEKAVTTFSQNAPQVILMASHTAPAALFAKRFRAGGGISQLVALSHAEGGLLARVVGKEAVRGVVVVEVAPNPNNETQPVVREFRAAYKKFGPADIEVTDAMMEGYLAAKVLGEGLKRAGGSHSKLTAALASLSNYDAGGVTMNMGGATRTGATYVELSVIDREGRVLR